MSSKSIKHSTLWLSLVVFAFLGVHLGCDRQVRHEVLTFFFDGVPPLEDLSQKDEELLLMASAESEAVLGHSADLTVGVMRHKPVSDCVRCHEKGTRWERKQLFKPVPQLCYDCHTNYAVAQNGVVHAPVMVGSCLSCHDPHQSSFENLLVLDQPDVCYQCHQKQDVMKIADHEGVTNCTQCHDPHVSSEKHLLKTGLGDGVLSS